MCNLYSQAINIEHSPVYCYRLHFKCLTVSLPIKKKFWRALKSKKTLCSFIPKQSNCNHATYQAGSAWRISGSRPRRSKYSLQFCLSMINYHFCISTAIWESDAPGFCLLIRIVKFQHNLILVIMIFIHIFAAFRYC